jgi:antitoxin component of MazEF toxin-antitoxin module
MSKRKVIKTGNSLAVTLPSAAIKNMDIKVGDIALVEVKREKNKILLSFPGRPRQLSLVDK